MCTNIKKSTRNIIIDLTPLYIEIKLYKKTFENYFKNKVIMNMKNTIKKISQISLLGIFTLTNAVVPVFNTTQASSSKIVYPLQQISKLECRFNEFDTLSNDCKQQLPILKTKDYSKYVSENGWYNDFTRLYTVLWGSSYKYGWDVWHGGHIGTDIATAKWTPIYAIADGEVIHSKTDVALWKMVSIEHFIDGKKIVSNYAHMSVILADKWEKVSAGDLIGKVGSTGNSTWNHLHFQLDLDTPFHPYYYDYSKCPYSYYSISEQGLCFSELEKNTIDPLKFLETNWEILKDITVTWTYNTSSSSNSSTSTQYSSVSSSIFDRTVYIWYSRDDIKEVQQIYKDLWVYNGSINGNYEDIEDDIIDYQLDTGVISSKNENGAGWFWPKTRAQTESDYEKYLANWSELTISEDKDNNDSKDSEEVSIVSNIKTEKISQSNILTREEIEAREVNDFLDSYNVSLSFEDVWGNIEIWKTTKIKLNITDRKWKPFKWSMPWGMTFIADDSSVQIFPEKLYYFTDGKRDILVKWLKAWNITISVLVWGVTIKRIPIKIYESWEVIYPEKAIIVANNKPVLWENNTAFVVFQDSANKNLINLEFGSTFKVNTNNWSKICLKEGSLSNLWSIINQKCSESEYSETIEFTYNETIWGILLFDFKSFDTNTKLEIINTYDNTVLATKDLSVQSPKWLASNYVYKDDIMSLLSQSVADGINQWYFLEDRDITKIDALTWIENALNEYKNNANNNISDKIVNNINSINILKSQTSSAIKITRSEILTLTYEFLVFDTNTNVSLKNYKDLDNVTNIKASYVLNNTTWKDQFGNSYFQPDVNITRWEAAFMINNILNQNKNVYLTLNN